MRTSFVHFSSIEVPALPTGHQLLLNPTERIATLLEHEHIYAQCHFSNNAFRLLFFLLRAPRGANYAELLACLRCSEMVFRRLLATSSYEDARTLLAPQIERWNRHLEQSAEQGNDILERELKMVRRAAKERHGVSSVLRRNGFTLTVKAMYRKGYLLAETSSSKK